MPEKAADSSGWEAPAGVFERLNGRWRFERIIADLGIMRGLAFFVPGEGGETLYREEGLLQLKTGGDFTSNRNYVYSRRNDGFAVFFAETPRRLFHEVRLSRERCGRFSGTATHTCSKDFYETKYEFGPGSDFFIGHTVTGPRKNYSMRTHYARLD